MTMALSDHADGGTSGGGVIFVGVTYVSLDFQRDAENEVSAGVHELDGASTFHLHASRRTYEGTFKNVLDSFMSNPMALPIRK